MVVGTMMVDLRSRSAGWAVESRSGWTMGPRWAGGREPLVVDRVVSLRVEVEHAGEAGGGLVAWKSGLVGHARARFIGKG